MLYSKMDCPTCGNENNVKSIKGNDIQKCRWCGTLFRVVVKRKGSRKFEWNIKTLDEEY